MKKEIGYYLFASYHRKMLDSLLEKNIAIYQGIVLDIGGRDRGKFRSPKDQVKKWITTDIEASRHPDIVLDVANMPMIENNSIDVINAIELFEHVEKIKEGLDECQRVLRIGGKMIISVPFLFPFHADPYDFQRWTEIRWRKELMERGLKVENFVIMGKIFTVLADQIKAIVDSLPFILRFFGFLMYPFLDILVLFDKTSFVLKRKRLGNHHGGYFIICSKD